MKKLLIVESPAKIKTISKFLPKNFKIVSTLGHIKDLPSKKLGVYFNNEITVDYEVLEGKNKAIADIKKEAKDSDEIFLAPDPDREGEIIAWHVDQEISKVVKDKSKIHRITFNEITKSAIEQAISNPTSIDINKVSAQQARRILDRLVGYEVSPVLWKKVAKGLSAGRVQSVTLKLIVNREQEIKDFKQEEHWSIDALFIAQDDASSKILATLFQVSKKKINIENKEKADKIAKDIKKHNYKVSAIKDTDRLKNPSAPFMTSTLQQAAYNQLGFNVQKTMQVAQKLYEGVPLEDASTPIALITYMRTDSLRVSDSALKEVRAFISSNYSKDYLPVKPNIYSKTKSSAQDAHEAIRPIDPELTPDYVKKYISSDQAKLYELIWKRFVSSQVKPAKYAQRQVTIEGGPFIFKATGSTLIFDGFLKVYNGVSQSLKSSSKSKLNNSEESNQDAQISETNKEVIIPASIKKDLDLSIDKVLPKQHFTQPPPRFSEALLVKELEKEAIGRPSTYATILKTIQLRAYTTLDEKKKFVPTELGIVVTNLLNQNLSKIMDLKFTANMEKDLDKIASGELERDNVIKLFYNDFEKDLEAFRGTDTKKVAQKTGITCPKCTKEELLVRFGKSGSFLGCVNYPECTFSSNFQRLEDGTIKLIESENITLEEKCPKCEKQLRQVQGKYGKFVACSGYPNCTYIQTVRAGFDCPACKTGDIIQRVFKGSKFWGCSNYPNCKFLASGQIEPKACRSCKWPFVIKRVSGNEEETLVCANKECKK